MADPCPTRRPWFILAAVILALMPLAAPVGVAPTPLSAHATAQTLARQAGRSGASTDAFTGTTPVTATYTNPIYASIPMSTGVNEDCPDPSIIHGQTAGDTNWYAYCTSGPLNNNDRDGSGNLVIHRMKMLSSHDLVTWTYRGDVLGKSSDAPSTRPRWLFNDSTFAPDIRYVNNTYYLYYAAPDTRLNQTYPLSDTGAAIFVVTSTAPLGPWTADPTPVVEPEAPPHCCDGATRATIDPALITDDTVTPTETYIFYGSYFGGISARKLSADGLTSSVSETQVMTGRTPLADITIANRYEAPYIVKHGGYFYLFASATNCCNGALTSYGVFVGRAPHALGPYVDREGNSFLSGRVGGDPVVLPNGNSLVGIGHNAIFTDEGGQDWYLSHGIQRANPTFTNGDGTPAPRRPLVMDPLDWGADGWPVVRGGFGASDTPRPAPAAQPGEVSAYTPVFAQPEQPGAQINGLSDEFDGSSYGPQWTWVRGDMTVPLTYSVSGGSFNFDTQVADLQPQGSTPPPLASVLTEPTPAGDYIVDTKVHFNLPPEGCCQLYAQAGLVIYSDNSNYVKLVHVSIYETRQTEFGKHDATGYGNGVDGAPGDDTYLRIVKTTNSATGEELYRAYTSQDGVNFVRGGVWTHNLGSSAKIGLVSMGLQQPSGTIYTANFDYVHVYQFAGESSSPTPTGCGTQTVTANATVSGTQTVAASATVSGTQTVTASATVSGTQTVAPSATMSGTQTVMPTSTLSGTQTVSPTTTMTGTQTGTTTATQTTTPAASSTATAMASSTATGTATTTATCTPAPTSTGASSATATGTSMPTATATATGVSPATATATGVSPATATATGVSPATATGTSVPTTTATATGTSVPTTTATSTSMSIGTATNSPTNTATNSPTNTATNSPTNTATNSPTNTATNSPTNTVVNTPTGTAVPATTTGTATSAPATSTATGTRTATATPTPRPTTSGCVVAFVQLRAQPRALSRPALAVNDLRNVFGEGSRAVSRTPLFFSDGRLVAFLGGQPSRTGWSYRFLACGRYTLIDLRGAIFAGETNLRGRRHTDLRGDSFRVRVTRDAVRRRQPLTFSVRVEIPRIGFDRTYHRLRGSVDIPRR